MKPAQSAPSSMDAYIAAFLPDMQVLLEQIRTIIREAAPDAQETISYAMPTFTLNGRYLVYFGAYKKHVALYPAPIIDTGRWRLLAKEHLMFKIAQYRT